MPRQKDPDEVRQRKRDEILDAAMAVFENAGGLEALSFRKLAAELSLSYSAPYRYFANKEELVNALRARAYRWIEREMLDSIQGITHPERQLETLARAYVRAGLERPDRYALMFFKVSDPKTHLTSLELKSAKRDALYACVNVVETGQASGDFPKTMDALTAAHLFWATAHGLVSLQVAGQFQMGRRVDELVPILIRTLRTGMEHFNQSTKAVNALTAEEKKHG